MLPFSSRLDFLLVTALLLVAPGFGHGGRYRPAPPPNNIGQVPGWKPPAPMAPGGRLPSTPANPSKPKAPGPQAPQTRADLSKATTAAPWEVWWSYHGEAYLQVKSNVHASATATGGDDLFLGRGGEGAGKLRPTPEDRARVASALHAGLDASASADRVTGSLVALAKLGEDPDRLLALCRSYLSSPSYEVREAATLSLGIRAHPVGAETLLALLLDNAEGRSLVGERAVSDRVRAFAAFALGLLASEAEDSALRHRVVMELAGLLEQPSFATQELKVACVSALGLLPLRSTGRAFDDHDEGTECDPIFVARSIESQLAYLERWMDTRHLRRDRERRRDLVRDHVPTAMARLAAASNDEGLRAAVMRTLLVPIERRTDESARMQHSCVLGLAELGRAGDGALDIEARARLLALTKDGPFETRGAAWIALGKIAARPGMSGDGLDPWSGTTEIQGKLGKALGDASLKTWAALALGVHVHGLAEHSGPGLHTQQKVLSAAARTERSPQVAGAFLLALGLARDPDSNELLRQRFDYFEGSGDTRGYTAMALGMAQDHRSLTRLHEELLEARYRPGLLVALATGCGLLGDKTAVGRLIEALNEGRGVAAQASLAQALGRIGDRSAIDPLLAILGDKQSPELARAFAASALGSVCDRRSLPWSLPYSIGLNPYAVTPSLTGSGKGLLDWL